MKRVERAHLAVVALTDEGKRGKKNEDRFAVSAYRRKDRQSTPALLAVVADGIGGHRAGEVAAEMAVNLISEHVADSSEDMPPVDVLRGAVQNASQAIYKHAAATPGREGMGATCAIVYVVGSRLFAANIGDSRIYLLRNRQLTQLSTDHTWIKEALDNGLLSEDQIQGHPNAHVIRRFLGSARPPEASIRLGLDGGEEDGTDGSGILLLPDDILLLCSDGLTDLVSDEEINAALSAQPIEAAARGLIDLANQRGGHDNITLIVLQSPHTTQKKNGRARMGWRAGCLATLFVILLGGIVVVSYHWLFNRDAIIPAPGTSTPLVLPTTAQASQTALPVFTTPSPRVITLAPTLVRPTLAAYPAPLSGATLTPWPTFTSQPGTSYP